MTRPIVSAEDVRAARRASELRLTVPPDAIVTPLAREEAGRWGIELIEADADSATIESVSNCSCDDSDLDRVVERVRTRVPEADPRQVREIARRVLQSRDR